MDSKVTDSFTPANIGLPLANFANEWPIFGADGLPFLADSYDSAMKLYQAQKPLLEKKLGEQGMMLLYAVAWPPQGIYSKKPLANAADLKGIKWRAYVPGSGSPGSGSSVSVGLPGRVLVVVSVSVGSVVSLAGTAGAVGVTWTCCCGAAPSPSSSVAG